MWSLYQRNNVSSCPAIARANRHTVIGWEAVLHCISDDVVSSFFEWCLIFQQVATSSWWLICDQWPHLYLLGNLFCWTRSLLCSALMELVQALTQITCACSWRGDPFGPLKAWHIFVISRPRLHMRLPGSAESQVSYLASLPGQTQLSVACTISKQQKAG